MLHLRENIKLIRLVGGQTQEEFGAIFGATKAMIKSYESGKAKPDELFISRLARHVCVPENDLLNKRLTEANITPGVVEKVEKPPEILGLLMLMYEQMRAQNAILDDQRQILKEKTISQIKDIQKDVSANSKNITEILAGVSSLQIQMEASREVILGSLGRIENLKEGHLLSEVGKTARRNMKGGEKQGSKAVIRK